ncbi:MAG: hypothetical protein WD627_05000 [Actinomycetota bacterium]
MARLCELRIREGAPEGSSIPFDIELTEVEHHPPLYGVSEGKLVDTSPRSLVAQQRIEVRSDDFLRERPLPPLFDRVAKGKVFAEWVSSSEVPRPWGSFDWTARRMVVEVSLDKSTLPWEQLAAPLGAERVALLRQLGKDPPSIDRYLDSRIEIATEAFGMRKPRPRPDDLFDGFVQTTADKHHSVAWDRPPEESDVWHLMTTVPEKTGDRLKSVKGPRVLVVQVTAGPPSADSIRWLLDTAFQRDAWAVVVAEVPETSTHRFFHPFYRKLLHNWPLEFCVWAGMHELEAPGYPARLYARPGGELALSVTRIPAELAVTPLSTMAKRVSPPPAAPPPAQPPAPPRGRPKIFMDRRLPTAPRPSRRGARPPTTPGSAFEVPTPPAAPPPTTRRSRVIAEVGSSFEATAGEVIAERFKPSMARMDDLPFDEEEHDHSVMAEVAAEIRSTMVAGAPLIEEVATSPPGPRRTNVTFFRSGNRRVEREEPLSPGRKHRLEVIIEPTAAGAHVSEVFDESALVEEFRKRVTIDLDVVVFSPETEFVIPKNRRTLVLPRVGSSDPVKFEVTPQHEGWCALRVAIYYRNTMLQSLAVRAYAGKTVPAEAVPTIRRDMDWAATTDLQLLDDLPEPVVNIFSNEAPDGSHWIGVFSEKEKSLNLRSGEMWQFDNLDLTKRVETLRARMQKSHGGEKEKYLYPSADKPPFSPEVVGFGKSALIEFAKTGYLTYRHLFTPSNAKKDGLKGFQETLRTTDPEAPGIVSVARCDGKWTAPWATLYDKFIDVDRHLELHVCPVFEEQLKANEWSGNTLKKKHDLLDDPAACSALPQCPLKDADKEEITVCPFGFWGLRYQIEQPLQQVKPVESDAVPRELTDEAFNQTNQISRPSGESVRVGAGAFPFSRIDKHRRELEAVENLTVDWESERPKVLQLFYKPEGHHLLYFYCHGRDVNESFALQVGPLNDPQNTISPASIRVEKVRWAKDGNPQPLVMVIACESLAARPEVAHQLFEILTEVGASGVIGAEISIAERLGREVGLRLMSSISGGTSVGEALLEMRLSMLRRFNPLGLALTANAPATLHLCDDPNGGGACKRYHRVRSK